MKTNPSENSARQSVGHQNILPQRGGTPTALETKLRLELLAVGKVLLMKITPRGFELTVG